MAFDRSLPQSLASHIIADSEHFWPRLRFSPLRLKTASAFGSIDCSLHSLQSSVTSLASCGFTTASTPCGHKLSSHFHSHFSPDTSGCAYGVGFVPITVCPETSACFSEPSMTCCRAPSSITHLRHTDSRAHPTQRGRSRLHSTHPARSFRQSSATPVHRPCRAERIYRRRPMAMPGLSTPPGARRLPSLRTLPPSVDCVLSIASPEHFWPRLRYSLLRLKTAAVFGSIDCSLRLHSASSTPPSLRYGGMTLHSGYTRKLSLATTFRLSPTPLLRRGVGPPPFHRQPETSACNSGPSIPCRRSPSSGRRKPTISALLPTHRGSCHCHSVRRLPFIYRLRRYAHPPICGAPMH